MEIHRKERILSRRSQGEVGKTKINQCFASGSSSEGKLTYCTAQYPVARYGLRARVTFERHRIPWAPILVCSRTMTETRVVREGQIRITLMCRPWMGAWG